LDDKPSERSSSTDLVPYRGPVWQVESRTTELERPVEVSLLPAVLAATGGFALGVASFILVQMLRRPKPAGLRRGGRRRGDRIEVAATRSFLIDVHLLDRR